MSKPDRPPNRLSLQARFLLGQALGFVAIIVVMGIVDYENVTKADREDALRAGGNYAQTFVELIAQDLDLFASPGLQALVLRSSSKLPGLERVTVSDINLRIVADSEADQIGRVSAHASAAKSLASGRPVADVGEDRHRHIIEQTFPILGLYDAQRKSALVGLITVRMDLTASEAAAWENIKELMFWFSGLLLLLLGTEAWLLRRHLFLRLIRLGGVLDRIQTGDYAARATPDKADEIGALTTGFNLMAEAIESAHVRTRAEAEVRERAEAALAKANLDLEAGLRDLEDRSNHITSLAKMANMLHMCASQDEATKLLPAYMTRLFLESSGAFYLLNPSRDLLERGAIWGDNTRIPVTVSPAECWALRTGVDLVPVSL